MYEEEQEDLARVQMNIKFRSHRRLLACFYLQILETCPSLRALSPEKVEKQNAQQWN